MVGVYKSKTTFLLIVKQAKTKMSTSPNHGLDIDDIVLSQLTEEEIAELNDMIDPDVSLYMPYNTRLAYVVQLVVHCI